MVEIDLFPIYKDGCMIICSLEIEIHLTCIRLFIYLEQTSVPSLTSEHEAFLIVTILHKRTDMFAMSHYSIGFDTPVVRQVESACLFPFVGCRQCSALAIDILPPFVEQGAETHCFSSAKTCGENN